MEKIEEIIADQTFLEKFSETESAAEAVSLFAEYGIDITEEQLLASVSVAENKKEELNPEDLDQIVGGSWVNDWLNRLREGFSRIPHGPIRPRWW